jgi:hypothetical protein
MDFHGQIASKFKLDPEALCIDIEGAELVVYLPPMADKEDAITTLTTLVPSGRRTSVVFADDPYVVREVRAADEVSYG